MFNKKSKETIISDDFGSWNLGPEDSMNGLFDINIESMVDDWAKENINPDLKAAIDGEISKVVAKAGDDATTQAVALVTQQTNTPENQNAAITGGVNSAAQAVSKSLIGFKEAYRIGGVSGAIAAYPTPFYIAGGIMGLIALKMTLSTIGAAKGRALVKANPRKRKSKKK